MRLRLIISFALVVLVTVASVGIIARMNTAREVHDFIGRGGIYGLEGVVVRLENYYSTHGSWLGVDAAMGSPDHDRGKGQGGPGEGQGMWMPMQLQLADAQGNLLVDAQGREATGRLSQDDLSQAVPLEVDGETVGYLLSEGMLAFPQEAGNSLLERINRATLTAAFIAGGAALILALLLAYHLLRPVQDLTHAATHLAEGDLSQRVPIHGDDELAALGRTFNHMAASLQHAEESRRALTADIAHELRTPLAVQRAHLEAIQDGIYPLSIENLAVIEEQTRLLTRLVEDLRTLALADAGQLTLERAPTDVPALVERVAARFGPQAAGRQIEVQLSLGESCPPLPVDSQRIEQILNNLLDNALRYTPEGGVISVQCAVFSEQLQTGRKLDTESWLRVTVKDAGCGILEENLPHIFERFYRADKSRARSDGGTGLGLSIARKLAQAHGGDLTAANHPGGGAVFSLNLPVG